MNKTFASILATASILASAIISSLTFGTAIGVGLTVSGTTTTTRLCIGTDCRTAWPSSGGSGSNYWLDQTTFLSPVTSSRGIVSYAGTTSTYFAATSTSQPSTFQNVTFSGATGSSLEVTNGLQIFRRSPGSTQFFQVSQGPAGNQIIGNSASGGEKNLVINDLVTGSRTATAGIHLQNDGTDGMVIYPSGVSTTIPLQVQGAVTSTRYIVNPGTSSLAALAPSGRDDVGVYFPSLTTTGLLGNGASVFWDGNALYAGSDSSRFIGKLGTEWLGIYVDNATTTNATTTNLFVSGLGQIASLLVNGQSVCLANGTNCPSSYTSLSIGTLNVTTAVTYNSTGTRAYLALGGCSGWGRTTAGTPSPSTYPQANGVEVCGTRFNATTTQYHQWSGILPLDYATGTPMTLRFYWTATGTTSGSTVWSMRGVSIANNESLNATWGSWTTSSQPFVGTNYSLTVSTGTLIFIPGGTPAPGEKVQFEVRTGSDVGQTIGTDSILTDVKIEYQRRTGITEQ